MFINNLLTFKFCKRINFKILLLLQFRDKICEEIGFLVSKTFNPADEAIILF